LLEPIDNHELFSCVLVIIEALAAPATLRVRRLTPAGDFLTRTPP